jgi:uncharacterized membrane protein
MKDSYRMLMYFGMLVFDITVLAGTTWLVAERGWSGWWFALTVFICSCSSPRVFFPTQERQ